MQFRIADLGLAIGAATVLALCGGCLSSGGPTEWRQRCRHTYLMEVPRQPQHVHQILTEAMYTYGWGEDFTVHHDFWPDKNAGSIWVTGTDPRELFGFIVDVETTGIDQSKITIYPQNKFFSSRSRDWIERTLNLRSVTPSTGSSF